MTGAEPAAEHQAREYLDVTNPLLIGNDRDRKRCYHRDGNPCPAPDRSNQACSQQTGQRRITPGPPPECGKSPPGDDNNIGACCRSYCPEWLPDDLADNKAGITQVQLRRDSQIRGCLPVSLAQGIAGPVRHVTGLRHRLHELNGRLAGCPSSGTIRSCPFLGQLWCLAWCERLQWFTWLRGLYLNLAYRQRAAVN